MCKQPVGTENSSEVVYLQYHHIVPYMTHYVTHYEKVTQVTFVRYTPTKTGGAVTSGKSEFLNSSAPTSLRLFC